MKDIKILVSCHRECNTIKRDFLFPIHVGAEGKPKIEGFLRDDEKDNISNKNARYCELTAQYWAWKNLDAEYFGFFHYRRYLAFCKMNEKVDTYNNVVFSHLDEDVAKKMCFDTESLELLLQDCDIIVPYPAKLKKDGRLGFSASVEKHFKQSHDIKDLKEAVNILVKLYPEYSKTVEKYLKGNKCYFLNMYIMKKDIFFRYCNWLFPILDEFDKNKDYTNSSTQQMRMVGFLAERLFGVFLSHLKQTENIRIKHTRQCFFENTDLLDVSKAFDSNNVTVCLSTDDNYAPYAGVVIKSIVENSTEENNYDIIVLCNGVNSRNKEKLKREIGDKSNFSIRFFDAERLLQSQKLHERHDINKTTYLRLFIPYILKSHTKAIYLDCDIAVDCDIAELFNTDLSDNLVGAVVDTIQAGWNSVESNQTRIYNKKTLRLKRDFEYFNAGVLVMNLSQFRSEFSLDEVISLASSYPWWWQDQDVLNMLCEGRALLLEQNWNVLVHDLPEHDRPEVVAPARIYNAYLSALQKPKIVHYAGKVMPVLAPDVDLADVFFKYATKSVFYAKLLDIMQSRKKKKSFGQALKDWLLKRVFPPRSRRREFAKRIYYGLKPKRK